MSDGEGVLSKIFSEAADRIGAELQGVGTRMLAQTAGAAVQTSGVLNVIPDSILVATLVQRIGVAWATAAPGVDHSVRLRGVQARVMSCLKGEIPV